MTTCPTCSKPLGNDRFCIGPLTAPHPAVYPRRSGAEWWGVTTTERIIPVTVRLEATYVNGLKVFERTS